MTSRQRGFSALMLIIILVVIAAISFGGWYVYQKNKKDDSLNTNTTQTTDDSRQEKTGGRAAEEPKIPKDFIVYNNEDFGFSLAYPKAVGQLRESEVGGDPGLLFYASSVDGEDLFAPYTDSSLTLSANKKEGFTVRAGKYGPILEFNDGAWIVSDKEDGDILDGGYEIGSEFKAPILRTPGGTVVYDLSSTDEGCHSALWIMRLEKAFINVSFPSVCADEIDTIPQGRLDSYQDVLDQVLETVSVN